MIIMIVIINHEMHIKNIHQFTPVLKKKEIDVNNTIFLNLSLLSNRYVEFALK